MGFRGEALPSIASVSRFTLTTRERDGNSPEGTQIIIAGGKISEVKAAGSATGTSIEVRQLFFNLPARRKFLRTEETEAAHIQHYLTLAALAYPEVAFTFVKDGRNVWQLPAQKSGGEISERLAALRERLRAMLGQEKVLPVDFSAELSDPREAAEVETFETAAPAGEAQSAIGNRQSAIRIWGFIGAPGVSRATREDQHAFVNRRPVENRGINFALLEGYHTALMKGRYPVCCLFLEIAPAAVDVKIHPSKREVKFQRESEVRKLVAQAVRETLIKFHSGGQKGENIQHSTFNIQRAALQAPVIALPGVEKTPEPIELPNFAPPLPQRPAIFPTKPEQTPLKMGFAASTVRAPESPSAKPAPPPEHST